MADFGLSMLLKDSRGFKRHTNSFCANLEYVSIEATHQEKYSTSAELWSLEFLIFELIVGQTPCFVPDQRGIFPSIRSCDPSSTCMTSFRRKSLAFSRAWLHRTRSGLCLNAVQAHEWFRCIDWDSVANRSSLTGPLYACLEEKGISFDCVESAASGVMSDADGCPGSHRGVLAGRELRVASFARRTSISFDNRTSHYHNISAASIPVTRQEKNGCEKP